MPTEEITIEDLVNWYCEYYNIKLWKDIPGFEGYYKVSNTGELLGVKTRKLLKTWTNNSGYKMATLYLNGIKKNVLVHRCVAEAFVPNPNNHPQVNHIDEVKSNCNAANLEWCDVSYNNCYGGRMERYGVTRGRPVAQYNQEGTLVFEYPGVHQAARETGINRWNIRNACLGIHKTAGGFIWKYA